MITITAAGPTNEMKIWLAKYERHMAETNYIGMMNQESTTISFTEENGQALKRKAIKKMTAEEDEEMELTSIMPTLKALKKALAAGNQYRLGETVLSRNGYEWRLVDLRPAGNGKTRAILETVKVFTYAPFARPTKEHRWGWNNYMESQIRKELNTEWLDRFFGTAEGAYQDETDELEDYKGLGKIFLMSDEEVGDDQTEETFGFYKGEDEDEIETRRQKLDMDGDESYWFLRSPLPGSANRCRLVGPSGALSSYGAGNGYGAVAACEIIF